MFSRVQPLIGPGSVCIEPSISNFLGTNLRVQFFPSLGVCIWGIFFFFCFFIFHHTLCLICNFCNTEAPMTIIWDFSNFSSTFISVILIEFIVCLLQFHIHWCLVFLAISSLSTSPMMIMLWSSLSFTLIYCFIIFVLTLYWFHILFNLWYDVKQMLMLSF